MPEPMAQTKPDGEGPKRQNIKKKLDVQGVYDEDETIHEKIQIDDRKKMSYQDVTFIIKALKSHFFFTNLSEDELEMVISKMFYAEVNAGKYVFKQNDSASCFFIIGNFWFSDTPKFPNIEILILISKS